MRLQTIFNSFFHALPQEKTNWFVRAAIGFITERMRTRKNDISRIWIFYNRQSEACIVKLRLKRAFAFGLEGEFIYFLLQYQNKEITHYGLSFENTLCDNDRSIKWIYKKQLLVFSPDKAMSTRLNSCLI